MYRRIIAALGSIFVLVLLLACGGGSPNPTITSPTAAPAADAPTAAPAAAAEAPTTAPAAAEATAAPEATSAPAAPAVAKIGDKVELDGFAVTVTKAERTAQIGDFQKAQDGREFIVVEALFENISADKEKADYNPFYFKVKDSEGFEFNATVDMGPNSLKSGNLDKGGKARGTVVFDVAKGAKGFVMSYQNVSMTLNQTTLQWSLGDI